MSELGLLNLLKLTVSTLFFYFDLLKVTKIMKKVDDNLLIVRNLWFIIKFYSIFIKKWAYGCLLLFKWMKNIKKKGY